MSDCINVQLGEYFNQKGILQTHTRHARSECMIHKSQSVTSEGLESLVFV